MLSALARNKKAKKVFESFSSWQKRESAKWVIKAKTEATREKRIDQSVEWISEGKPRNWKYMKDYKEPR